jgi:hypothetical protein
MLNNSVGTKDSTFSWELPFSKITYTIFDYGRVGMDKNCGIIYIVINLQKRNEKNRIFWQTHPEKAKQRAISSYASRRKNLENV